MLTFNIKCTPQDLKETIEKELKARGLCIKTTKFGVQINNRLAYEIQQRLKRTKFKYTVTIKGAKNDNSQKCN